MEEEKKEIYACISNLHTSHCGFNAKNRKVIFTKGKRYPLKRLDRDGDFVFDSDLGDEYIIHIRKDAFIKI